MKEVEDVRFPPPPHACPHVRERGRRGRGKEGTREDRGEEESGRENDGELSEEKNIRIPIEPRYALRKRNHPQLQQHAIHFLTQQFEKLTIHEVSKEDLSKPLKESVDPMGINFPPLPFAD